MTGISSVAKSGREKKKDVVYFSTKKEKCLKELMNLPNLGWGAGAGHEQFS